MNPLTNVKNITKLNETELASGSIHKKSWHDMYKDSAWIFIGGLEYGLTEGDILAVFSQYGEIVNINLVRDKKTGKSKGFCFLCYANQKSTVLAVDNFNGIKLCKRTIRVDHVSNYKPPKENERDDEITKHLKSEGCAPQVVKKMQSDEKSMSKIKKKKSKKEKKEKKRKKKRKNKSDASGSEEETSVPNQVQVKEERHDPGYDKYDTSSHGIHDDVRRHKEKSSHSSRGEKSHADNTSRVDKHNYKTLQNNVKDRDRLKIKKEPEDSDNYPTSSRSHKRKRSASSSDDQTRNYSEDSQHIRKSKQSAPKELSNHKRKHKEVKKSSSSSDDGSSTQSSEEENHRTANVYSQKSKHETHSEKRSFHEGNSDRSRHRGGDLHTSNKSRHHDKNVKFSEHKSRVKYHSENNDHVHHKDSHYHKRRK